ncbi:MAG: hypothetical protein AAF664_15380, partial [Planctomycetota bacterium]
QILRWDLATGDSEVVYQTELSSLLGGLAISNDSKSLYCGGTEALIKVSLPSRKIEWQSSGRVISIVPLANPNRLLALHSKHAEVAQVRDTSTGDIIAKLNVNHLKDLRGVTPDAELAAFASPARRDIVLANAETLIETKRLHIEGFELAYAAYESRQGRVFGMDGKGRTVVWNAETYEVVRDSRDTKMIRTELLAIPGTEWMLSIDSVQDLLIWDPGSGKEYSRIKVPPPVKVVISRDGKQLLTTSNRNKNAIFVWDFESMRRDLK